MNRCIWLFVCAFSFVVGCHSPKTTAHGDLQRFEFQKPEMGVPFRIVLYAPDEAKANEAAGAAFRRIEELNDHMSDYDPDSELSQLSKSAGQAKAVKVSDDLWRVLEQSQRLSEQTAGAFDVTVGPVVQLWRTARREKRMPDVNVLTDALARVGFRKLKLDPKEHTAQLAVTGMKLDLGAIAKGFADDEAMKVLRAHGIKSALISGGGDMAVSDPPPGKTGWRIELAPLDVPNAPPTNFVTIANCGLATSGDLFQHVELNGKRYSHIVDPHTGIGLTDHSLVIVIAPNGMMADGLSTSISVLGPDRGKNVAEIYKAAFRVARKTDEHVELIETPTFQDFLAEK